MAVSSSDRGARARNRLGKAVPDHCFRLVLPIDEVLDTFFRCRDEALPGVPRRSHLAPTTVQTPCRLRHDALADKYCAPRQVANQQDVDSTSSSWLIRPHDHSPESLHFSHRQNVVYWVVAAMGVIPRSSKGICMPMRRVS
jgi:hypothetical protein